MTWDSVSVFLGSATAGVIAGAVKAGKKGAAIGGAIGCAVVAVWKLLK